MHEQGPKNESSRRKFLVGMIGVGAAGALGVVAERMDSERRLSEAVDILRKGKGALTLDVEGRQITVHREDLINTVKEIIDSRINAGFPSVSPEDISHITDSFGTMIEVEHTSSNGTKQQLGRMAEYAGIAKTYGISQLHPDTAKTVFLKYRKTLIQKGFISEDVVARVQKETDPQNLINLLQITEDMGLVLGLLYFYEMYNLYGRDSSGNLHANREQYPYEYGLAVAAYSSTPRAPAVAQLQNELNERIIFETLFKSPPSEDSRKKLETITLLEVDGDLGGLTLALARENNINTAILAGGINDPEFPQKLREFSREVLKLRAYSDEALSQILIEPFEEASPSQNLKRRMAASALYRIAENRYSVAILVYNRLKNAAKNNEGAKNNARSAFMNFIEDRDPYLLKTLTRPKEFDNMMREEGGTWKKYMRSVGKAFLEERARGAHYSGTVPTAYKDPWLQKPRNIMGRVLKGMLLDEKSLKENPEIPKLINEKY